MRLFYAIIISLLAHAVFFVSWSEQDNFSVESTQESYQVTLLKKTNKNIQNVVETAIKPAINTVIQKKNGSQDINDSLIEKISFYVTKAYVISHIKLNIKNNFKYPILARRNGWQGKVVLGLSVNAQGDIENAHIKVGSGYRILDQSALKSLLKVKNIRKNENWLDVDYKELTIPVIYRLQEG